jgi:DUF4097 and DUF4098 domain-containing protein YvlB
MHLEDVQADNVEVKSNSGEIYLGKVKATGAVTLNTDFGAIKFLDGAAQSLTVATNSGEVSLETLEIKERVDAQSDFGTITLTDVTAAAYDVQTNSGGITLTGVQGSVKLHTDFGDVTVTRAEDVTLNLSTNSGVIEFAGSLGQGPHTLKTDFGAIRLELPKSAALTIDFQTDFGRIKSDLPITLTGEQDNDHWLGSLNGGGEQLNAQTNSGDITLETLSK